MGRLEDLLNEIDKINEENLKIKDDYEHLERELKQSEETILDLEDHCEMLEAENYALNKEIDYYQNDVVIFWVYDKCDLGFEKR